uniref:FERM domain-containing protein n=1 Tax=Glossina morsitans morsitans TaxID=37546 RepID=A0A1B0G481_GLOMM
MYNTVICLWKGEKQKRPLDDYSLCGGLWKTTPSKTFVSSWPIEAAASLKKICLNIYWPNNTHHAVSIDDQTETVQDVIEKTIALVPSAQKPNFKYYALRLQNMITKETLWMNKTSKIQKLLIHIWNATCPNTECPQLQKNILLEKPLNINDNLNIWRPELRIRYLPNSIEELHAEDKITCHFYFDQVYGRCENHPIQQFSLTKTNVCDFLKMYSADMTKPHIS